MKLGFHISGCIIRALMISMKLRDMFIIIRLYPIYRGTYKALELYYSITIHHILVQDYTV